jgi:hypothetical protein
VQEQEVTVEREDLVMASAATVEEERLNKIIRLYRQNREFVRSMQEV